MMTTQGSQVFVGNLNNVIDLQDQWDVELDTMGAAATPEELQAHLERAPNPESATAQYLAGFLTACATTACI